MIKFLRTDMESFHFEIDGKFHCFRFNDFALDDIYKRVVKVIPYQTYIKLLLLEHPAAMNLRKRIQRWPAKDKPF